MIKPAKFHKELVIQFDVELGGAQIYKKVWYFM